MKGKVLNYDASAQEGVIASQDGDRFKFQVTEWNSQNVTLTSGLSVDFLPKDGAATEIYAEPNSSSASSKKLGAALFALFLGAFGAHKFYLGYTSQGIIMLMVFLFGWILLGIPSIIIGIIAFIEFIIYLVKSDEEFEQVYVIGNKPWF